MLFNAVMCVWNEEDVIESTVKHLFRQGCSNVFIIDNDSTDRTVETAVNAGAKLAAKFTTKDFDEDQKVTYLNATVKYVNENTQEDSVWWLYVDADEFPHIEGGLIIDYLNVLGKDIRAVHGYHYNHMPTHQPYFVQGYHPADFQPLCVKSSTSKIPLIRYDKGNKHLFSIGGAHDFITHNDVVPVVKDILQIHHFQYRNPEYTLIRSKTLAEKRNEWMKKFAKQLGVSDSRGYESRYNAVFKIYNENKNRVLKTKSLSYNFKHIARWYDINSETKFSSSYYENSIFLAIYYFFMQEYDTALCRFNDAYVVCNDDAVKHWIMLKIAECFSYTDIETAMNIVKLIQSANNVELNEYIDENFEYIINSKKAAKAIIGKIEFYQSIFPDGIEEKQNERMAKIEKILSKYL
jgi:glycosyltransferase involved in cell wall biosynthesis